jgi:hypothetical protein
MQHTNRTRFDRHRPRRQLDGPTALARVKRQERARLPIQFGAPLQPAHHDFVALNGGCWFVEWFVFHQTLLFLTMKTCGKFYKAAPNGKRKFFHIEAVSQFFSKKIIRK